MPNDLRSRLQDIGVRTQSLRPNIIPQLQQRLASVGGWPLLGRLTGNGGQKGMSMMILPGMARYGPSASPIHGEFRGDMGGQSLPSYPSGFRPPT